MHMAITISRLAVAYEWCTRATNKERNTKNGNNSKKVNEIYSGACVCTRGPCIFVPKTDTKVRVCATSEEGNSKIWIENYPFTVHCNVGIWENRRIYFRSFLCKTKYGKYAILVDAARSTVSTMHVYVFGISFVFCLTHRIELMPVLMLWPPHPQYVRLEISRFEQLKPPCRPFAIRSFLFVFRVPYICSKATIEHMSRCWCLKPERSLRLVEIEIQSVFTCSFQCANGHLVWSTEQPSEKRETSCICMCALPMARLNTVRYARQCRM